MLDGRDSIERRAPVWRVRLWRHAGGATAIETAILLPLMLAFLLGIEELGRLLWTQSVLQYASETAARCAAIASLNCSAAGTPNTPTQATVASYASSKAFGLYVPASNFTFAAAGSASSTCGGPQVTATYTFVPLVPQLVSGLGITLNAKSCLPEP